MAFKRRFRLRTLEPILNSILYWNRLEIRPHYTVDVGILLNLQKNKN